MDGLLGLISILEGSRLIRNIGTLLFGTVISVYLIVVTKMYHYYMAFLVFHSPVEAQSGSDDNYLMLAITFETLDEFQRKSRFSGKKCVSVECCQLVSKRLFARRHHYWHFLHRTDIQSFLPPRAGVWSCVQHHNVLVFVLRVKDDDDSNRKECH
jgi:hypothetical protein